MNEKNMDNQINTHIGPNITNQTPASDTLSTISIYSSLSIAILTFCLVPITAYYAYQTCKLSNIANKQMQLSAEPNIDLLSDDFNTIDEGKVKFNLSNQCPLKLTNIKLYSKYYTHLIDSNLMEYTLYNGIKSFLPDETINEIEPESQVSIEFDYSRSGLTGDNKNVIFYLDGKKYTINDIVKFCSRTYAEYRIDFQREIDGKHYSKAFYYLIALHSNPREARFIRQTKDEILNSNREMAVMLSLIKSANNQ